MLPAGEGGGSVGLRKSAIALSTFKKRIDTLLSTFEGSAGSSTQVGDQRVSRAALGGGGHAFPEADGLFSQYHRVHERLTSLSKLLGQQIEALGIAVHGADIGFDNLDEEQRRRFHAIQTRVDYDHHQHQQKPGGKPAQPENDAKDSDAGWR